MRLRSLQRPQVADEPSGSEADLISPEEAGTLPGLFRRRCERSPEHEAYRQFEETAGWRGRSWREMAALVARWQLALSTENLLPGDRVAINLRNGVEWVCFDMAAQSLGLVVVPVYVTDHALGIAHILADSGARLLLLERLDQWMAIRTHVASLPALTRVLCLVADSLPDVAAVPRLSLVSNWLPYSAPPQPNLAQGPQALATIIYTSGTTGPPKGVMLSHRNILSNASAVLAHQPGLTDDVYLSFLPLSHAFERTAGYYVPMMAAGTVAFARAVEHLAQDILTVRPTVLISVPRIYERIHARIQQRSRAARALFQLAITAGWQHFEAEQRSTAQPTWWARTLWPSLRRLVAKKLLDAFGGRLRLAVTGGAPMSTELARCFLGLGVPLVQGYGLTEASPVVASNRLIDNVPESVGRPLPGVQVRLGPNDELQVRGPNVMLGYWKQASDSALDAEGWLHTGDQARIQDGRIFIVGRLKEIIVLSTGEKVAPADLELALTQDPLIDHAMIIGEGKSTLAALLVLNAGIWGTLATRWMLNPQAESSLADERLRSMVQSICQSRLNRFPHYAQVRRFWLTLEPWTVDNRLITPTLKLKRADIEKRYIKQIRAMLDSKDGSAH